MNAQIAAQTARTPGPWEVANLTNDPSITSKRGLVAHVLVGYAASDSEAEANAAFIVQACNAHDDLVAALRAIPPYLQCGEAIIARAALAKAGAA